MAQLQSMQRDNQAIRRDNEAMRKELAALRRTSAQDSRQSAAPANAPSRSLSSSATEAMAADMPVKAYYGATPYAPYNWSGLYAGLNAGYGFGSETSSISIPPLFFASGADTSGFFGGGQLGYNGQFSNIVLGIEADIQYAAIAGPLHVVFPGVGGLAASNKLESFGTIRGRIGYAFDRVLVYGTGGFAAGQNTMTILLAGDQASESAMHTGWTAGGGIEYGIRDGWSVKAEYLHVDLGSQDTLAAILPGVTISPDLQFDLVRAGVNYRF